MPDQTATGPAPAQTPRTLGQRIAAGLPIGIALTLIAGVWLAGAIWSFEEQTAFAHSRGFHVPELLPLVLDGMSIAMAAVAFAASLDGRPATLARLGTALAIGASAASNAAWADTRSASDQETVILAAGVPVFAMVAFEVLLAELRRQVMRRRGQAARVPLPELRLIRVLLAPWALWEWRRVVLDLTAPDRTPALADPAPVRAEVLQQTPLRTPVPDPLPAITGPAPAALSDRPHQTPAETPTPNPEPVPVRRPVSARRTPVRRSPRTTATVSVVRSGDDDAVIARLRRWQTDHDGQTPSLDVVQRIAGGGRSRAIRLRSLLIDQPTADPDRVAV